MTSRSDMVEGGKKSEIDDGEPGNPKIKIKIYDLRTPHCEKAVKYLDTLMRPRYRCVHKRQIDER